MFNLNYSVSIRGVIPISEFKQNLGMYSTSMKDLLDEDTFLTSDGKLVEIDIPVYAGRTVKCYGYFLDLTELVTDLSVDLNEFFTTKMPSSATINLKTNADKNTALSKKISTTVATPLYNLLIRVGATVTVSRKTSVAQWDKDTRTFIPEGDAVDISSDSFLFSGKIEEVGISDDSIEIKAFDSIQDLVNFQCPLTCYTLMCSSVGYDATKNAKSKKKSKLKVTLSQVLTVIDLLLFNNSTSTYTYLIIPTINTDTYTQLAKTANSSLKELLTSSAKYMSNKHPFEDEKYAFELDPIHFQGKNLAELLHEAMDRFFSTYMFIENLSAIGANSADVRNHIMPVVVMGDSQRFANRLHSGVYDFYKTPIIYITTQAENIIHTSSYITDLTESELWTSYAIQSSASSVKNEWNFERKITTKDPDGGKEKAVITTQLESFPSTSKENDSSVEDLINVYLNSQVKYGIRSKGFTLENADIVEPMTIARDLSFYTEPSSKIKVSLQTSALQMGPIELNMFTKIGVGILVHINKLPFSDYWLVIATVNLKISNATLTCDIGLIPCMAYETYTQLAILPPKNVEYFKV